MEWGKKENKDSQGFLKIKIIILQTNINNDLPKWWNYKEQHRNYYAKGQDMGHLWVKEGSSNWERMEGVPESSYNHINLNLWVGCIFFSVFLSHIKNWWKLKKSSETQVIYKPTPEDKGNDSEQ